MPATAILQDTSLCIECQACRVACQMQNQLPADVSYTKFVFRESGTFPKVTHHVVRMTCQHCTEAACVAVCPTGAVTKGSTGLTAFDPARCSGCAYCAQVCPFSVPTVPENRAVRCVGCPSLTENGQPPACVQTCLAGALGYGPRAEMLKKAEQRVAALKARWPHANVYSPQGVGGTGVIWVLRDRPEAYGLPVSPVAVAGIGTLKNVVQPAGLMSVAATALVTGLTFVMARRNAKVALEQHEDSGKEG